LGKGEPKLRTLALLSVEARILQRVPVIDSPDAHMTADTPDAASRSQARAGEYPTILPAGERAPGFTLHSTPDQMVTLDELRGRPLVLAFYPADWSPVCSDQMALYNQVLPEFKRLGAQLVGISVDGVWCHKAFGEARNLHFPLLSDFEPKAAVSQSYGAYRTQDGTSERALFVLDNDGVVFWSYLSPVGVNPGAEGILDALERLQAQRGAANGASKSTAGTTS
jgi:peroxiredoxin